MSGKIVAFEYGERNISIGHQYKIEGKTRIVTRIKDVSKQFDTSAYSCYCFYDQNDELLFAIEDMACVITYDTKEV